MGGLILAVLVLVRRDLDRVQQDLTCRLCDVILSRPPESFGHAARVTQFAAIVAQAVGMSAVDIRLLRLGAPLHDIGMIRMNPLGKTDPLTDDDWQMLRRHPLLGHQMLDNTDRPAAQAAAEIALSGRIVAIADVFDSLLSPNPRRPAWSIDQVPHSVEQQRGRHFDPVLANFVLSNSGAFLDALDREDAL